MKRSMRVDEVLVTLVGSVITCVNWYASIILTRRIVCEFLESSIDIASYINIRIIFFSLFQKKFKDFKMFDWRVRRPVPKNTKNGLVFGSVISSANISKDSISFKIPQLDSVCKFLSPAFLHLGTFIHSRISTCKIANSRVPLTISIPNLAAFSLPLPDPVFKLSQIPHPEKPIGHVRNEQGPGNEHIFSAVQTFNSD